MKSRSGLPYGLTVVFVVFVFSNLEWLNVNILQVYDKVTSCLFTFFNYLTTYKTCQT